MIVAHLLLAAGALSPQVDASRLDAARDATGEGLAFVELRAELEECYVHQRFRATLRFGLEEEFLRERAVQPFRPQLGVPVQLVVPWIDGLSGARALGIAEARGAPGDGERPTFVLNEKVRRARRVADRVDGERTFRVYELEADFAPTAAGELRFAAPQLRFAWATRFEESLLDRRVPVDRVDAFVRGEPLVLRVPPLPEQGRPYAFSGAVGRFELSATVRGHELRADESLKLELRIRGDGDLGGFEVPPWKELGVFRVLGVLDEHTPDARILTLDLTPSLAGEQVVPAIPFVHFDPGPPPAYRTAWTEPVDILVHPATAEPPAARSRAPARDSRPPATPRSFPWGALLGLAALGALVLVLILIRLRRR